MEMVYALGMWWATAGMIKKKIHNEGGRKRGFLCRGRIDTLTRPNPVIN